MAEREMAEVEGKLEKRRVVIVHLTMSWKRIRVSSERD